MRVGEPVSERLRRIAFWVLVYAFVLVNVAELFSITLSNVFGVADLLRPVALFVGALLLLAFFAALAAAHFIGVTWLLDRLRRGGAK